jgi:hypothetical protein
MKKLEGQTFVIDLNAPQTEIISLDDPDVSAHINVRKHIYADRVVLEIEFLSQDTEFRDQAVDDFLEEAALGSDVPTIDHTRTPT